MFKSTERRKSTKKGRPIVHPFLLVRGYPIVITLTGQLSFASAALSFSLSGTVSAITSAIPSAAIPKTAGQVSAHTPQDIHPSLSIVAFKSSFLSKKHHLYYLHDSAD
jgi:hypothetical protein